MCKSVKGKLSERKHEWVCEEIHWIQNKKSKRNKMSVNEAKSIETNETDCDNPISLDEIEKGLWLGWFLLSFYLLRIKKNKLIIILCFFGCVGSFTAAADIDTIKSRNITFILTLDICPLPVRITELPFLKTKFIHGNIFALIFLGIFQRYSCLNHCCFVSL